MSRIIKCIHTRLNAIDNSVNDFKCKILLGLLVPKSKWIITAEPLVLQTLSVFVYFCPPHCERNSTHVVRIFLTSFLFALDIVAHNMEGKSKNFEYVRIWISFKFWIFYWSIQSSFSLSFQKYIFFLHWTKIDIF